MSKRGSLFVLSGPSGSGKGTVLGEALPRLDGVWVSVSATTRARRVGEENGEHYYFLDNDQFRQKIENGEMLEYVQYCGRYYGTLRSSVEEKLQNGIDVILEIEVEGAGKIKQQIPDAILIFVVPPSLDALAERLKRRGTESDADITSRLIRAKDEYQKAHLYDYIIINENFRYAATELAAIIVAQRCKCAARMHIIKEAL